MHHPADRNRAALVAFFRLFFRVPRILGAVGPLEAEARREDQHDQTDDAERYSGHRAAGSEQRPADDGGDRANHAHRR